jgi:hypothetical protein
MEEMINLGYNTHIHGNVTRKLPGAILNKQKCLFTKMENRMVKQVLSGVWHQCVCGRI